MHAGSITSESERRGWLERLAWREVVRSLRIAASLKVLYRLRRCEGTVVVLRQAEPRHAREDNHVLPAVSADPQRCRSAAVCKVPDGACQKCRIVVILLSLPTPSCLAGGSPLTKRSTCCQTVPPACVGGLRS
nr:hypothetical protein CFP56_29912 [Quercus suber]